MEIRKTRLSVCSNSYADRSHPDIQHVTTETRGVANLHEVGPNTSLHQACEEGKLCTVQFLLSLRPDDINTRDKLGRTPVMAAVMNNQNNVFDFLVSRNCDLMAVDINNDTVLHVACQAGGLNIVRKLTVDHTCDIEGRGKTGLTPVLKSALSGHRDVVELLVREGCNVSTLDDNMNNILHVACLGGHVDMVKYVISTLHVDIESRGEKGRTPVMVAAHSGHIAVVDFLTSKGCNMSVDDDNKDSILHVACIGGHVDMVEYILNQTFMDIESKANYGRTPVMRAAEYGRISVVDFLVRKKCDIKTVDDNMDTLLHIACVGGHLDVVKYIQSQQGISIDSIGKNGWTPVMDAANNSHLSIVKYLASKECDLSKVDRRGNNIFHIACMRGHLDIVKYIILQEKIPINGEGVCKHTPVMIAAWYGHASVYMFLVDQDCELITLDQYKNIILHLACDGGCVDIVKHIVEKLRVGMEEGGRRKWTPVLWSSAGGHVSVVKYLVEKSCKLTVVGERRYNVLHYACLYGHGHIVEYILSQTDSLTECRDTDGRTPVMIAARSGSKSAFMSLVKYGCKLKELDLYKNNILHLACMGGNVDIVKYIVKNHVFRIEGRGIYRRTPVMNAAGKGHRAVFMFLVSQGCKLGTTDKFQDSILHLACSGGNVDIVKYIVKNNVFGIERIGGLRRTPVMRAASGGHRAVFMFLVHQGCRLKMLDYEKNTVLHLACSGGNVDIVKYIVENHIIGIERRGRFRWTPVMNAVCRDQMPVVKYLVGKGCNLEMVDTKKRDVLKLACTRHLGYMANYLKTLRAWPKHC